VKWPEKIDNRLNELGLTYDAEFDYEPKLVNFEGEDSTFFLGAWPPPNSDD
jgi:hypothetical protein